jgi:signal transduction histidine kinase
MKSAEPVVVAIAIGEAVFGVLFDTSAEAWLVARRDTHAIVAVNPCAIALIGRTVLDLVGCAIEELAEEDLDLVRLAEVEISGHGGLLAYRARALPTRSMQNDVAMLAWRAAMAEVVSGVAHHINNPLAALTSTIMRMRRAIAKLPPEQRVELERLGDAVIKYALRLETSVATIVSASRADGIQSFESDRELPAGLETALSTFAGHLDGLHRRPQS